MVEINPYFITSVTHPDLNSITIVADLTRVAEKQKRMIVKKTYERLIDKAPNPDEKTVPAFVTIKVYPFSKIPKIDKKHFKGITDYTIQVFADLHDFRLACDDKESALLIKRAIIEIFNKENSKIATIHDKLESHDLDVISLDEIVNFIQTGNTRNTRKEVKK